MSNVPHELAEEFPEHREKIHALKISDAHFTKLMDKYHELNREIHRAESHVEPTTEDHESQLSRQRLAHFCYSQPLTSGISSTTGIHHE